MQLAEKGAEHHNQAVFEHIQEGDGVEGGIQVDAVLGVKAIASDVIRRVHQVPDSNELFESVIPHVANSPTLCILDVARLMHDSCSWAKSGVQMSGMNRSMV